MPTGAKCLRAHQAHHVYGRKRRIWRLTPTKYGRALEWRIAPCCHAVHPQLADLACRLLEGRPVLLLLGGQSQTRLEAGKPRLTEGPQVLGLPALGAVTAAALLGLDKRRAGNRKCCCSGDDGFPHGVPSNQPDVDASTSRKQPSIKLKFC